LGCYHSIENNLRVIVSDTGIGIPPDKISKLFTEFGKIDFSDRNPQGCGLGLNISNSLVKLLGGDKIYLSYEEGKGSVFSFQIDIREHGNYIKGLIDDPDYEEIIEAKSMINIREMDVSGSYNRDYPRLLIVDDMEFMREIMELYLSNAHIQFDAAIGGQDTLAKVIQRDRIGKQYSLIVLDCEMPGIDGYTVSKKINELYANHSISRLPYILAHTAHSSADDRVKCLNAGMLDCIVKPCKENEFIAKILSILN
jgi:CheY-like chemotaxis protein